MKTQLFSHQLCNLIKNIYCSVVVLKVNNVAIVFVSHTQTVFFLSPLHMLTYYDISSNTIQLMRINRGSYFPEQQEIINLNKVLKLVYLSYH